MKDSFYSAFENKYRGSRELISSRLSVYIPVIDNLKKHFPDAIALDLGCGRGEWLELVKSLGFIEKGVDLDQGMLNYCHEKGLNAEHKNALDLIAELPDNSVALITSFHLVEHIGFDNVNTLIKHSLRVLQPGGLLIIETPNPENIVVACNNFFLDPTHDKPIPCQLLSFLAEYNGFLRTNIMRLQEDPHLLSGRDIELFDVLNGVSPDYSIVAQKESMPEYLKEWDWFFSSEYGLSLENISKKYSESINNKIDKNSHELHILGDSLQELRDNNKLNDEINSLKKKIDNLSKSYQLIQEKITYSEDKNKSFESTVNVQSPENVSELIDNGILLKELLSSQAELRKTSEMLISMRSSTSWKVTSPLRFVGGVIKGERNKSKFGSTLSKSIRFLFSKLINYINNNPKRRMALIGFCSKIKVDKLIRPIYLRFMSKVNVDPIVPQDINDDAILGDKLSSHGKMILDKLNR